MRFGARLQSLAAAAAIVCALGAGTTLGATYAIVDTGQTDLYDEAGNVITTPAPGDRFYGQDGQHTGNQPAFVDHGDGTVSDLITGLMWQKTPDTTKSTFDEAVAAAPLYSLASHDDWRLPTISELYSLIDFTGITGTSAADSTPYIDTVYFDFEYGDPAKGERFIDAQFVTGTEYVWTTMLGDHTVFGVNFADGRIKGYGTVLPNMTEKTFFVRHVRSNPDYGRTDLVDNGDGTVSDRATELMWTQTDSGTGMNWEEALAWVEQMNAVAHLGHDDWRLPNTKELHSILDYNRSPDTTASAAIDPTFDATAITNEDGIADFPYYWTGTTHLDGPIGIRGTFAVYLAFGRALGYMEIPPGSSNYMLLDVHGAGAQRSDPKAGNPANWPLGNGPQGDVVRIDNFVRMVRTEQAAPVDILRFDSKATYVASTPDATFVGVGPWLDPDTVLDPAAPPLQFYLVPATSEIRLRKLGLTVELNFP